ncbi:MAG: SDR family oxidoreductase [Phycisphaeraceae bacterium]|nr:SDR family oxidoreductase [Phycisphaeraceae bacterium]
MSGADGTVMITGAARRVGLATAMAFASRGWRLVLTYRSSGDEIDEATARLKGAGAVGIEWRRLDLARPEEVERFAAGYATDDRAPLDVLVHNASAYSPSPLAEITPARAVEDYTVNALSPLLLTKGLAAALSRSARAGGGAVVAMCDIHALGEHGLPRREFASYAMSKAALAEMVRSMARDLAPRVRVNGVAPGVVAFPESGHESDKAMQQAYLSRVPLGRSGTPEDAAEAVRWLAMDATYVTGEILRLDGGRNLL